MFYLAEDTELEIEPNLPFASTPFGKKAGWMVCGHTLPARCCLIILANTTVTLPEVFVAMGDHLHLTYGCGLPKLSPDGLVLRVSFVSKRKVMRTVFESSIHGDAVSAEWRSISLPLTDYSGESGRFVLYCDPGPQQIADADWLAIAEFAVASPEAMNHVRGPIQPKVQDESEPAYISWPCDRSTSAKTLDAPFVAPYRDAVCKPTPSKELFQFWQSAIFRQLEQAPIQFGRYLEGFHPGQQLTILCLISGPGETEHRILKPVLNRAHVTLASINFHSLEKAAQLFPDAAQLELAAGDIVEVHFEPQRFDLILSVSGLHQIAALESVFASLAHSLKPDGEFLVAGEYVGMNGVRLDSPSYEAANRLFSLWPEKLRINHTLYEEPQVDSDLANGGAFSNSSDCGRSEDIERTLASHFQCKTLQRHNTFSWKLFNYYAENFDLGNPVDRSLIETAAYIDAQHQLDGTLTPSSLDGIYRLRTVEDGNPEEPTHQHFVCNICSAFNVVPTELLTRETRSCMTCDSSLRLRTIVGMLSQYLFGRVMPIADFPLRPDIKGCGTSDWEVYGNLLQQKFNYTNTYYHQEPRLDITDIHGYALESFDFITSTDVFEHILPPVQRAFDNAWKLLKPGGVFVFSVPYSFDAETKEHFPDIHDFEIVERNGKSILENRTRSGEMQIFEDLVFHGGVGKTLEMRLFSKSALIDHLKRAGFRRMAFFDKSVMSAGLQWPHEWSLPLIAVK